MDVRGAIRFCSATAVLCALMAAPAWAGYDEATALQNDAGHTGFASGGTLDRPPLEKRWEVQLGTSLSYPVIADGKVFAASQDSASMPKITALDADTGATLWWRPANDYVQLAYDGGSVYALSDGGVLTAIDGDTGATRWVRAVREPFDATAPIAIDGVVYVYLAWSGGALYAIDGDDGSTLWTHSKYWGGTPAADARNVYLGDDYDCSSAAVDRATGAEAWTRGWDCYGYNGDAQTDGARLYAAHGMVSDTATGKEVEQTSGGMGALAGATGVFRAGGTIFGRNLVTGTGRWTFAGDGNIGSPPLVVNGIVYAGSRGGQLFAVDLDTGQPVWQTQVTAVPAYGYYDSNVVGAPGMAAGQGILAVPAGGKLVAFGSPALVPRPGLGLRITSGPHGPTSRDDAEFAFSADGIGFAYECRLDSGSWDPCAARTSYEGLGGGAHIFEVRTVDGTGETIALASRGWSVKAVPKPRAVISGGPTGTTRQTYAQFTVSTVDAARAECRLDGASWTACGSPATYNSLGDGQHTFEARGVDAVGNVQDPPAARTWVVDTRPPDTAITSGPTVSGDTMTVSFAGEAGGSFQCRVGSVVRACSSPARFENLDNGTYTVAITAFDAAGNADPTPASAQFTIGEPEPNTRLDSGPPDRTRSRAATFTFSSSQAGVSFECRWDGGAWTACSSPDARDGVADGTHTFAVRAVNGEGTADGTPAEATWQVDGTAPETWVDSASAVDGDSWRFAFSSSEGSSTFRCQLDHEPWADCASPATYDGLAPGTHDFRVAASDALGNPDGTPAEVRFLVPEPAPVGGGDETGTGVGETTPPAQRVQAPSAPSPSSEPAAAVEPDSGVSAVPVTFNTALGTLLGNTPARTLARRGALSVRQVAPAAGKMSVRLKARQGKRSVALGRGSATWTRSAAKVVRVRLTSRGRKLLRRGGRVKITLVATFTPSSGGAPVRSSVRLTVR